MSLKLWGSIIESNDFLFEIYFFHGYFCVLSEELLVCSPTPTLVLTPLAGLDEKRVHRAFLIGVKEAMERAQEHEDATMDVALLPPTFTLDFKSLPSTSIDGPVLPQRPRPARLREPKLRGADSKVDEFEPVRDDDPPEPVDPLDRFKLAPKWDFTSIPVLRPAPRPAAVQPAREEPRKPAVLGDEALSKLDVPSSDTPTRPVSGEGLFKIPPFPDRVKFHMLPPYDPPAPEPAHLKPPQLDAGVEPAMPTSPFIRYGPYRLYAGVGTDGKALPTDMKPLPTGPSSVIPSYVAHMRAQGFDMSLEGWKGKAGVKAVLGQSGRPTDFALENAYRQHHLSPSAVYLPQIPTNIGAELREKGVLNGLLGKPLAQGSQVPKEDPVHAMLAPHVNKVQLSAQQEAELDAIQASMLESFHKLNGFDPAAGADDGFALLGVPEHLSSATAFNEMQGHKREGFVIAWFKAEQEERERLDYATKVEKLLSTTFVPWLSRTDQEIANDTVTQVERLQCEQQQHRKYLQILTLIRERIKQVQEGKQSTDSEQVWLCLRPSLHLRKESLQDPANVPAPLNISHHEELARIGDVLVFRASLQLLIVVAELRFAERVVDMCLASVDPADHKLEAIVYAAIELSEERLLHAATRVAGLYAALFSLWACLSISTGNKEQVAWKASASFRQQSRFAEAVEQEELVAKYQLVRREILKAKSACLDVTWRLRTCC